jgi:hypothetical protein
MHALPSCPRCGQATSTPDNRSRQFCTTCRRAFVARQPLLAAAYCYFPNIKRTVQAIPSGDGRRLAGPEELPLRLDLWNHSPTGFAWGYQGSGPAQLALAILAHFFGPGREQLATRLHQPFKRAFVAQLPQDHPWHIDYSAILAWLCTDSQAQHAVRDYQVEFPFDALTAETGERCTPTSPAQAQP